MVSLYDLKSWVGDVKVGTPHMTSRQEIYQLQTSPLPRVSPYR
jgi:hypothetical protein